MAGKKIRRGRFEGSVHQKTITRKKPRADGSTHTYSTTYWVCSVSLGSDPHTGKLKRKVFYFDRKEDAVKKLRSLETAPKPITKAQADLKALTVAAYLESWLADKKLSVRPTSFRDYDSTIRRHVLPYLSGARLDQFDPSRVRALFDALKRAGVSAAMRARVHLHLGVAMNAAVQRDLIVKSPIRKEHKVAYRRPPVRALTAEQANTFLESARTSRLEALFVLAIAHGLRQGELFGLCWDDVDWSGRMLRVERAVTEVAGVVEVGPPKSASGRRRIALTDAAVIALERRLNKWEREGHGSDYIFTTPHGQLLRKSAFMRRDFAPIRRDAGIPDTLTFHHLRHSCASLHLLQGTNPRVVAELLGHSDIALTLRTYSHVLPGMQQAAATAMDAVLGGHATSPAAGPG